jgi:hypothetical protein
MKTRVCARVSSVTRHEVIRAALMGTEIIVKNTFLFLYNAFIHQVLRFSRATVRTWLPCADISDCFSLGTSFFWNVTLEDQITMLS